jgi:hypothetical protein
MPNHLRRPVAAAVAAIGITAAAIAAVGVTAASATQRTAPAVSGTEHFQIVSTSVTATTAHAIGYGLFTAPFVDRVGHRGVATFAASNGTFKFRHSPGTGSATFNPKTCLLTITKHGTYKISGGTGKYAGISGHGSYQLNVLAIAQRVHGKCSQSLPPAAFQQIIRASGPLSLP